MAKREHTDTVKAEMPQRLITQATAFYSGGRRCELLLEIPPFSDHTVDAPAVVCYAFSIELFLKLMILLRTQKYEDGHDLQALFEQLSPCEKGEVASHFLRGEEQLSCIIKDAARSFINWRYVHEHDYLDIVTDDLRRVCEAFMSTLDRTRPELKSWFDRSVCR